MSRAGAGVATDLAGKATALLGAALPGLYLLLTSTTTWVEDMFPYDFKRYVQFLLLLVLFLLSGTVRPLRLALAERLAATPRWFAVPLIGVFAVGVVSAIVNAQAPLHLANSLSEVALLAALVLGGYVIAACRQVSGRSFDQVAVSLLALTGLAVGLQELMGVLAAHAGGVEFRFRISLLHFSWPRFYNQVQSWTVPVLVALPLLFSRSGLARVICGLALGLHWYVILMTGGRGSFVSLLAAGVFSMLFFPTIRRSLLGWQAIGFLLGAVLYAVVLVSFEANKDPAPVEQPTLSTSESAAAKPGIGFYGDQDQDQSAFLAESLGRPLLDPMGRTWMWRMAWEDARANPLLGMGPMNYVCTSPKYIGHPHSFPLQLAAEWGIPVALAVCLLAAAVGWRTTRGIRSGTWGSETDCRLAALLLTGILAAALHSCLSGVLVMPASQVAGLLICGWLWGLWPAASAREGARRGCTGAAAGLLLTTALLLLGAHELRTMAERSPLMRPGEDVRPRIWQDAKVCRLYIDQGGVTN